MNLKLVDVKKSYGRNLVLDGINLDLDNGLYGFLGANGVGKTSLFKIISRYITDFQGEVIYPETSRRKDVMIGFLPQHFGGYPEMTIVQFLRYLGNIKAKGATSSIDADIEEKLELFNLTKMRNKKLRKLSGGQLRRVGLAQAFQLNPRIVLLDEPTTGLDPTERIKFKNYIIEVGREQIVLLSTHIVTDLEMVAKKIFILKDGNFVMEGAEEDLISQCGHLVWEAEFRNEMELARIANQCTISMTYSTGAGVKARMISGRQPVQNAIRVKPTLNDVYLANFEEEAGADEI